MNLQDYRKRIDEIDEQVVKLFTERMDISAGIAAWKKEQGQPVLDPQRERQKLSDIAEQCGPKMASYGESLYSLIFQLSRNYQHRLMAKPQRITERIAEAIANTEQMFPDHALVACQGVEGAYSQQAAEKLFAVPNIFYFDSFDGVFNAIDKGLCRYGILPLENSTAGSVNKVYDLMMKYEFSIVRSVRLKIDHCLLANKGVKLADVKEIYSHEQAIRQCESFLHTLPNVKIIPCENTAAAAKQVFESGRNDVAALSARSCAELYQLDVILDAVQDQGSNFTRFICISKKTEIYPGSDKTSLMLVLPHRPGALYNLLATFYALGININKLESRPIPNSDFEFMFYFDLDTSIYSDKFLPLFNELSDMCTTFSYLGSYLEVV